MQSNFLGWLKKFGLIQNILGPVKGQGIRVLEYKESAAKIVLDYCSV